MKPLTHEWVMKAEGDFAILEARKRCRLFRRVAREALGMEV